MAVRKKIEPLQIEGAQLIFRNFSGKGTQFNREGDRNFCVLIDDTDYAHFLLEQGWNVKSLRAQEEDEEPRYYISVKLNYASEVAPPKVYLIVDGKKRELNEETVSLVDDIDIQTCDLIINAYQWEVNGKTGIKGYLKTAYIVMQQDRFASKYDVFMDKYDGNNADVPF